MEKIFAYGSLQKPSVQQNILGRVVEQHDDTLLNYVLGSVEINGTIYPIAIPKTGSVITGKVFAVTLKELESIDRYETNAYRRLKVKLESGKTSWVYCLP